MDGNYKGQTCISVSYTHLDVYKRQNLIRGNIYNEPSIVVDTHVKRISYRLGLTKEEDPVKVEFDLMKALPKDCLLYTSRCV